LLKGGGVVAISLLVLQCICDSPRMECARRTTPTYTWRKQAIIEWSHWVLHCCLLSQCKALRTCRSGFPIATK